MRAFLLARSFFDPLLEEKERIMDKRKKVRSLNEQSGVYYYVLGPISAILTQTTRGIIHGFFLSFFFLRAYLGGYLHVKVLHFLSGFGRNSTGW